MRYSTNASLITRAPQWLLLSDIHFRAHDLDRIQRTAQWIETLPQKHAIQRVIICGDVLSSRTTQPTHVLSACYRFLGNLIDAVPRVDILLGNHDLAHKRDYTTTALDVLGIERLAPFVQLHSAVSGHEWDGRRVLVLPFREDQAELTEAVSRLDPRHAAETVSFAHLAIHKAVTQRHVVRPMTGEQSVRPMMHRGVTGPGHFAGLARTFTARHQQRRSATGKRDLYRVTASADLGRSHDEERGVVLLDPITLQHELLVNPHTVDFVTAELDKVLHGAIDANGVAGKHVMLTGELTQLKYVTARDKLLSHGARSVRNWSPITPLLQSNHRADFHLIGATVPASDSGLSRTRTSAERAEEAQSDLLVQPEHEDPQEPTTSIEGSEEPESILQMHPLDLDQHAQGYVEVLNLDASLSNRRNELIETGRRLIQESSAAASDSEAPAPRYQDMIATTPSCPHTKSLTTKSAPDDAVARHIFVAQPLRLTMTNFLGVQDTVTFDFGGLPRGSLALVVGCNGAGKSTILEAMTWCQFGRCVRGGLAVNDVVNDVAGRDCEVSLAFSNGYS
ncbi:Nuclease SbcCD subunit C [Cytospora mali]|uniref:Nuclease SbcCD subunit C n=1 Tax=Cytospora mali TaxID=578113 RepID=A0A194VEP6_CYTMA|nr:Nuclease SbcCD subunit C [Valsa mali var. pyri (nom. inval.)]